MGPCLLQNYNLLKIDGLGGQFQIYSIGRPHLFTSLQRQFGGKQLRHLLRALGSKYRHCCPLNRMCCANASILERPPSTIVREGKGPPISVQALQWAFREGSGNGGRRKALHTFLIWSPVGSLTSPVPSKMIS